MIGHRASMLAIFAISFGLLVEEIMLSAIFHVLLGAGTTVAAIAIALVGLSASGLFVYVVPGLQQPADPKRLLCTLLFWFAVSLMASAYLIMAVPISHGDLIYHRDDISVQLWRLVVYHVTVTPFFIGGLAIAMLFRRDPDRISALYFSDLVGAALGCVLAPMLLQAFGAPAAIIAAAIPAGALAVVHVLRLGGKLRMLVWLPAALAVAALAWPGLLSFRTINTMGEVRDARYRSFAIESADIDYERWALDAWTIIRNERIPQQWEAFDGWGLSDVYTGPIPEFRLVNYNARFSTYVTAPGDDPSALAHWIDADLSSLHHLIGRRFDDVLNIGAGGGREVLAALQHGARHVVAVDVSDVVVEDLMKGELLEFSGHLYADPRVEAVADEGRTFTERSSETFDLIEFSIVGGMNLEKMDLVRVDDLFTIEALRTYLGHLRTNGVFAYGMYSTRSDLVAKLVSADGPPVQPYIPSLRTLTGLRLAFEEAHPGREFADHVLIAALPGRVDPRYDLVHIIASLEPFTEAERARFFERCRALEFTILHPPSPDGGAAGSSGAPDAETEVDLYREIVETEDLSSLAASLPMSIWPATDDRPFQYALDAGRLGRAIANGHLGALISGNPLISLAVSIGSLAVALSLIPLLVAARRSGGSRSLRSSGSLLAYFACIGFAYMAVEIAALLKLHSYLGKPIYGLSVGLCAFLLSSGLGSGFTGRFRTEHLERTLHLVVASLIAIGVAFIFCSGPLFSGTIAAPLPARIAISVAAIFPLAFTMGMLFPIGIRLIAKESGDLVPWAWATNGCFSVLGIFGARIIALFMGFSRALMLGLVAYALVSASVSIHSRISAKR